jgi:hypothetical protein
MRLYMGSRGILRFTEISVKEGASSGKDGKHWMYDTLLFAGTRWPAAKVVARREVASISFPAFPSGDKVLFEDTLIIETTGQGWSYSAFAGEGWWRDFAELPLDDERRVLSFLRRRGDPFGVLAPGGKQITTCDWRILKATVRCAAVAWDPQPDATGVSHFRPEKLRGAEHMFEFSDGWASELEHHYSGVSLVLTARTLAAYLCADAAASVREGLDMRRCAYCSSWFSIHRSDARWCSSSCRAASSNKKRSPHAFVSQNQNTQGGDPVAEPVAGAGGERPPAGPRAKLRDPEGSGDARRANARGRAPWRRRPAPT